MPITYGSVCSGIEAATQAWHTLGMRAAWFAEIEPFPSAVLAHHYPDVPNHGDMTKLAALVLAGGTPCQAFSVAGMREGLTDPRGALTIKYVELADAVYYVRACQRMSGRPPLQGDRQQQGGHRGSLDRQTPTESDHTRPIRLSQSSK